jgi:L-seryl-tRNA(Ser) seleniumtransferase
VLHTGFGRAPIDQSLWEKVGIRLSGFVNLEFNLASGRRGERLDHLNSLLVPITGAESSLLVNNNAAAVWLTLNTIADGKEVLVSRGQEVEIGGSFRIPDIIRKSNCELIEVGTTNRTHLRDYEKSISEQTGLILWVHTSNYTVKGFTKSVDIKELVALGKKKRIPVMADLGSGAFFDLKKFGLGDEVTVSDIVSSGVDIITFSGDKLLGGPQAGVILGKSRYIRKIHANPIYRAVRCDKTTIALMEETLRTFLSDGFNQNNLTNSLLQTSREILKSRGQQIVRKISPKTISSLKIELVSSGVEVGSGSLPNVDVESIALKFNPAHIKAAKLAELFRSGQIPVVGYIKGNNFYIDLKAIPENQFQDLITAINRIQ